MYTYIHVHMYGDKTTSASARIVGGGNARYCLYYIIVACRITTWDCIVRVTLHVPYCRQSYK